MARPVNKDFLERLLEYIIKYKSENDGVAPCYREMMMACNTNSASLIGYYLKKLADRGDIVWVRNSVRNIRVPGGRWRKENG